MRILHITTHLNKGGITSYLSSLAAGLEKRGHRVIVSASNGEAKQLLLENNIEYLHIPIRTKKEISPSVLFSYFILKKFLLNNPVDIIHAHTRVTQVLASFLAKRFSMPLVTTCHGFFKPRWHRRRFPCWGDKVIAISNQVKEHLISDFGVSQRNICLIHHGVDLNKFGDCKREDIDRLKGEMGIPKDFFVIANSGRLSAVKGLEYFVKAIPAILKDNEKIIFLLIGYGDQEQKLRQTAKDLNVEDRIIFFRPIKDIYEYLSVIDIFVMPSIQEGLGFSILEAQAQKIPVIASNVGGIPDIIEDKVTGILIQPKDESALSRAILELIRDKPLYENIKKNAYNKILKEFTLDEMISETEKVYKGLLSR